LFLWCIIAPSENALVRNWIQSRRRTRLGKSEVISIERFIHCGSLALFKKRLSEPNLTEAERRVILELLAEEKAKDRLPSPPANGQGGRGQ